MTRLGARLRLHARTAADAPAVHAGDRWWSYGELVAAAEALAIGAGPGDVVAIAIERGIEAVLAVCATALAGAIPALIDPRDRELAARTLAALRPATVIVAPGDADLPGARAIDVDREPAVGAESGAMPAPPRIALAAAAAASPLGWQPLRRPEAIAHILFTSGSTASGKGVVWSELRAGYDWMISAPRRAARGRPSGIVVPLCASLGYHELVRSLVHGTAVALLDGPFPAALAQARALGVDRMKITPTHVELLLATADDLPALRVISVTSAPIAPDRLRALAARLPTARICRSYGLTESGVATMVWMRRKPRKIHSVGRPVSYRRVTVRDEAGRVLPPGQTGEVVIELPMWDACDGYLDAPPELARRFDNGALWTGDRGAIDEHGFLVLGSRAAEILKVGGRSVGAPRIEESLAALPGVAEVAVVGVPDRLLGEVPCAVFVPAGGDARRLVDDAPIDVRADELPRWFLARRELPRTASGKIRRGQLADEAAQWTRSFSQVVIPEYRPYPAFDLQAGIAVVDGGPPGWIGDAAGLDPAARIIALIARKPLRPIAVAIVQAGTAATVAAAGVRFIVGPVAVERPRGRASDDLLDVFAGELVVLAGLLPGPRPEAICAFAAEPRRAYAEAGFAAIAGHDGWRVRGEAGAPAPAIAGEALREVGESARLLAAWALRCASV